MLSEFIKKRPYLIWWTKSYDTVNAEAVVEATLNYGEWDDVQTLIGILGMKEIASIFRSHIQSSTAGRQNYAPKTKRFFSLYFDRHASYA